MEQGQAYPATDVSPSARGGTTLCVAEDRPVCEPTIQVLIASLAEHCPSLPIRLFAPNASPALRAWVANYPQCTLDTRPVSGGVRGWDVKPRALLSLLAEGYAEAIWIDSDIVIRRDFRPLLSGLAPDVIVATEEGPGPFRGDGEAERCRLWGFEVGRTFPHVLNSCVLRVTQAHRELLETWEALVQSPEYQKKQQGPWHERPLHMLGDQDVLTALLTSKRFAALPLLVLVRGQHIIQYHYRTGYSLRERLRHLFRGMPPFVHSQGWKPWMPETWTNARPGDLGSMYADLSPYTMVARRYRRSLTDDGAWMDPHSRLAGALRLAGAYHPPLVGLPLAIVFKLRRLLSSASSA